MLNRFCWKGIQLWNTEYPSLVVLMPALSTHVSRATKICWKSCWVQQVQGENVPAGCVRQGRGYCSRILPWYICLPRQYLHPWMGGVLKWLPRTAWTKCQTQHSTILGNQWTTLQFCGLAVLCLVRLGIRQKKLSNNLSLLQQILKVYILGLRRLQTGLLVVQLNSWFNLYGTDTTFTLENITKTRFGLQCQTPL